MMESVQAQSIHITETKPLCSASHAENGLDDISKQLENELLYGGGDDGEALSDDALSEDSYRLRVSDDENGDEKVDASKRVENHDNNIDKTELTESNPEVLGTNSKSLQLDKITNGEKDSDKRGNNTEDFAENFQVEQDNYREDQANFSPERCSELNNPEVPESSTSQAKKIIFVKPHADLSDISSDSNDHHDDDETRQNDVEDVGDSPKVVPTSRASSPSEERPESESVEDPSKGESSDASLHDNEKIDSEAVPTPPNTESNHAILENGLENDEEPEKESDEQPKDVSKSGTDEKDCPSLSTDEEPLMEKSEDLVETSTDPVVVVDENSKDESIKSDHSASATDKAIEGANPSPSLECGETISDAESEAIADQNDFSDTKDNDQASASKRRLSSSENDTTAPSKIACVEPQEKPEVTDDAIEILDEADEPAEKSDAANTILKSLLAEPKRSKSNDEIIDLDDDNTADSMSSGVSHSANDSLPTSDITTDRPKQVSAVKETNSEILDDSRTRRTRRSRGDAQLATGKEIVTRAKREAAQKAEVTVRKNIVTLNNDTDSDSQDSMVPYTPKQKVQSPSSLKRNMESDERLDLATAKKLKTDIEKENAQTKPEPIKTESKKTFDSVRRFFLRDNKEKLKKLTQEQLEELFIQKIVETITMREEIGKLREKAKISERNQEAIRVKCQQLSKQINDFEMVLNRFSADRRNSATGNATPIKINRSVGLQVNFLTDHGVQNLRQLQAAGKGVQTKILPKPPVNGSIPPQVEDPNARRGIKVRSPRRTDVPGVAPVSAAVQNTLQTQPLVSTVTPSSLSLTKPVETRTTTASTGQPIHHVVINGVTNSITRTKVLTPNNKGNANLIDLTDEPEKKQSAPPPLTAIITTTAGPTHVPKAPGRYQRVIPATTAVTIPQSALRVVQPAGQPTPTALVNNMSTIGGIPRFVVMQPGRQLVVANNNNPVRATTTTRPALTNIAYASVPTMANGTVRVVPTSGTTVQLYKHPAPLPDCITYKHDPSMKLPPPAPSLKISKVQHGIVLSWNMALNEKYAEIASYQLYAYQEITGMAPNTSNWKKVGDVRALPLPMACTLTQFSEGNNYYFAVRAVDTHSRYGQYSQPGNISLYGLSRERDG
ncbi:activating transcription factor 7-interacting protein 1 isoform X2 [Diachasma alloeum]|uniref:activating transcription factor 7-interacting protein 1 isoform X2 n=1 Tax=Diachasma alloeum TaxID=454923 RepID=UPI00073846C5|nr:activating transcription factor 7-interacting protein 1 isoform X2 [Diachasma alloeum]